MPNQYTSPDTETRFWSKVNKTNTCWFWTATINKWGYGYFGIDGKTCRVHRLSYMWAKGEIPKGFDVDHTCHNPKICKDGNLCIHRRCVNPDHLEAVTKSVNVRRSGTADKTRERQAGKTHCPKGHPYEGGNLYVYPDGGRKCRACRRRGMHKDG